MLDREFHRLLAVGGLADDREPAVAFEPTPEQRTEVLRVVGEQDADAADTPFLGRC
jgi:hypothetical protein